MSQTIKDFRLVVEEARKAFEAAGILLRHKEETLARMENQCQHRWSEAKYTPEHHESYTIPGDEPGTMGVDFRGPMYVPPSETPKWTRTCLECGKIQITTASKTQEKKIPDFGR
jgi:hypothetical protein